MEAIRAAIWLSDMRGFTSVSERLPPQALIDRLNLYFGCQVPAVLDHGGEVLKFMGDGLLAIFPIEGDATAGRAATNALEAAQEALAAVRRLNGEPSMADELPLEIVVALHVGTVVYGNIGAAQRLDFTVIGPAVNLVSRLEGLCRPLDKGILISGAAAAETRAQLTPLGLHALRGIASPCAVFTVPEG